MRGRKETRGKNVFLSQKSKLDGRSLNCSEDFVFHPETKDLHIDFSIVS